MSTEIVKQPQPRTSFNFFDAQQFETMQRISKMFAMSELVPDMYKAGGEVSIEKATANCMIAISLAQRMQADPLMVMQQLVIIYGRPSWSSKFLIATVNTCGRFEPLKYRFTNLGKVGKINITEYVYNPQTRKKEAKTAVFDGTELDNMQCVAYTKERGTNEELESSEVSIRMAIEEGWFTKNGSKWKTMPKKMLMYRAASFWTNEYAPEISMGMRTEEEVQDTIDIDHEDVPVDHAAGKVKNEINQNANETTLTIEPDPDPDASGAAAEEKPSSMQPNTNFDKPVEKQPDAAQHNGQTKAPF